MHLDIGYRDIFSIIFNPYSNFIKPSLRISKEIYLYWEICAIIVRFDKTGINPSFQRQNRKLKHN